MRKNKVFVAILLTLLLLFVAEVISTSLLPAIGLYHLKLGFHVLVVLFLAFRIHASWYPYSILVVEVFHSMFSIEGWAVGTLTGIIISLLVSYLKEMLDFSSVYLTMILAFIFQILWFVISHVLISIKMGSFENFGFLFLTFLPECFVLSIIAPFFFQLLDKVWHSATIESSEVHI